MLVRTQNEIDAYREAIIRHAEASFSVVREQLSSKDALSFFFELKFEKLGHDPINGEAQNLIEQINQMYSNLVVLSAVEDLLQKYPGTAFELQLGASSGYDILSTDGRIAAECFSVTSVSSNRKLDSDCKKLMRSTADVRCVYFYSHLDNDIRLQSAARKYPDIRFKRITAAELKTSTGS